MARNLPPDLTDAQRDKAWGFPGYATRYDHLPVPPAGRDQHAKLIQLDLDMARVDDAWAQRFAEAGEPELAARARYIAARRREDAEMQRGELRTGSR